MNLCFDIEKAQRYKSPSQIARVLTEDWAARNLFVFPVIVTDCRLRDNTKVIDFVCGDCSETYQLKSRNQPLGDKVLDAAYEPMIDSVKRIKLRIFFSCIIIPKILCRKSFDCSKIFLNTILH